jgi:hypothetical protein
MNPRPAALLLLLLLGCGPSLPYALRPASEGPKGFATQDVVFRMADGGSEHVLASVENDGKRLTIVASSPLGQTLFVLRTEDGKVDLEARVPLPKAFDPRLLAVLVELSDWPLESARKGLPAGSELREEGSLRTLLRRGKVLLTLDRRGPAPPWKSVTLTLPAQGLEAVITTLED